MASMLKTKEYLLCIYTCFLYLCNAQYTAHFGVFVEEENLQKFSDLTDSFFNQTDPSSLVSITLNFYNETPTLVLDDTYLTDDLAYKVNSTNGVVLIDVEKDTTGAMCHVAQWTNTSFVSLSSNIQEECTPTYYLQPSFREYLEMSLSLFQMSDSGYLEVILLTNTKFEIDTSVFVSDNDTLYSVRLYNMYNMNTSNLEHSLYTSLTDGATNRFIAIGTYTEIVDILVTANNTANRKEDQWIAVPFDSFVCPGNITMFSFVCIVQYDANYTGNNKVNEHNYDVYLSHLWKAINTYVSNTLYVTQNLNEYLTTTINASNTSSQLNIIKYNNNGSSMTESLIGYWTRSNGLHTTEVAFPNISNNRLTVVLIHEPPFITKIETEDGVRYEGYTIDILDEIARRLSFEYSFHYVPDGEYGVLRSDGTWSGIIGEVARGAADIGIGPISVTAERETVIDFTAPYYDFAGLQLLMRDPTVYNDMFAFASAFTGIVWVTWFSIQISTAGILYFFHRLQLKTFAAKPQHNPFSFKECVWFVMGSITLAGADRSPITFSSRILVAGFWFFCQIMMGTYTANLAAFMTSSRLSYSIESLEDLSTQTSISYSVLKGTVGETYFSRMANIEKNFYDLWKEMSYESDNVGNFAVWEYPLGEKYTKIWNAIQATGLVQTTDDGIQKLISDNFAYIHETPMIKYQMNRQCGLLTIGSPFSSKPYALVLQQNSPLLDSISKTILQMQSETIITELKDKWWKNSTITCPSTEGNQGLSMEAVGGIFIVMAIGCGISFLILFIELSWTRYKSVKQINKVKENENKMEMKDNHAFEDKDELGIPRKTDEDNLSVIDLNKYGYI
ncbi:ionotropic receptor 25a-like [Mytilus edulis]|uniref:ionotropic receptor 25a-like n=1 Tax=Mytilus edulis TaxID=6550 RepID=UPI0039F0819E